MRRHFHQVISGGVDHGEGAPIKATRGAHKVRSSSPLENTVAVCVTSVIDSLLLLVLELTNAFLLFELGLLTVVPVMCCTAVLGRGCDRDIMESARVV